MIYDKIRENPMFNKLGSEHLFDNAQGCASSTPNKTSIYLFKSDVCLARLCNISLSNIDGNGDMTEIPDEIDDFSVGGDCLIDMLSKYSPGDFILRMNRQAYAQLWKWWYSHNNVEQPERFTSFGGAEIIIDPSLDGYEQTVV